MQAHPACSGGPFGAGGMAAQAGELGQVFPAVGGAEECGIFDAGVAGFGIGQRGLQVPDALEFPGMLRPVVPLMRGERFALRRSCVVNKSIALGHGHAFGGLGGLAGFEARLVPGFSAIVGALDDLAKPAAGLRGIDAVGIFG